MAHHLEVQDASVAFQAKTVVKRVSFRLQKGQIGCLLGPSGCGKTTLLRAIAGFEPLTHGQIRIHGQLVSKAGFALPPEQRRVGMVFQDFALFPHLSVADNIRFGIRRQAKAAQNARIEALLAVVGMDDYGTAFPHELSGGQQQRVALARAMAPRPEMLLLDEPFSNMDVELREQLATEIRDILKQEGMTAILVTHDQHEAFAMADEIGVMQSGEIMQWDTAYHLYHTPANRFVADFIGLGTLLTGRIVSDRAVDTELGTLRGDVGPEFVQGEAVEILVRPDDVLCNPRSAIQATVEGKHFRGAEFLYSLRLDSGAHLLCLTLKNDDYMIGERVGVKVALEHLVMFKRT